MTDWMKTQESLDDALNAVIKLGFTQEQGEILIKSIAKNEIPHVSIKY